MVNFDIPSQYTFSPSEGTPHLTINREAIVDLDSSNAFEGKTYIRSAADWTRTYHYQVLKSC